MKCVICKTGQTHAGITTVTLQRDNSVVVIRDVPADICDDCGEYYLNEVTARRVYADADASAHRHVEVEEAFIMRTKKDTETCPFLFLSPALCAV